MKWSGLAIALATLATMGLSKAASGTEFPTEQDMAGIRSICGAGTTTSASVTGSVDAAIKNWRNANATAEVKVAKEQLAAALGRVKNDQNLEPNYRIYVDCTLQMVQKFLDQANKVEAPKKVSMQLYFGAPTGQSMINPTNGLAIPLVDIREVSRGDAELIRNDRSWIQSADQRIPAEQPCPNGSSAGIACSLDSNSRLSAYFHASCSAPVFNGPRVFRGCSRTSAGGMNDPMVQCCFFADGPVGKGLPFHHSLTDWLQASGTLPMAGSKAQTAPPGFH